MSILSSLSFPLLSSLVCGALASNASIAFSSSLPERPKAAAEEAKSVEESSDKAAPEASEAKADAPSEPKSEAKADAPSEPKSEAGAAPESKTTVSDGSPLQMSELGLTITPPEGWEVLTNAGQISLIMREPRNPLPAYEKAKYQRNITVAAIHKPSPIDEKRAVELKDQLSKRFSQDSMVSEFTILEHKFFDYRGKADGLIIYASMKIGDYPMMQSHVLIGGMENQFLMTYTDLAEQFSAPDDKGFEIAWNAMTSAEVTGAAPSREDQFVRYGAIAFGVFLLFAVLAVFSFRRGKKSYDADIDEDDSFESSHGASDDGEMTSMMGSAITSRKPRWTFGRGKKKADEDDSIDFTSMPESALPSALTRKGKKVKKDGKKVAQEGKKVKKEEQFHSAVSNLDDFVSNF